MRLGFVATSRAWRGQGLIFTERKDGYRSSASVGGGGPVRLECFPKPNPDITKPSSLQSSLPGSNKQGTSASVAFDRESLVASIKVRSGWWVERREWWEHEGRTDGCTNGSWRTEMANSAPGVGHKHVSTLEDSSRTGAMGWCLICGAKLNLHFALWLAQI